MNPTMSRGNGLLITDEPVEFENNYSVVEFKTSEKLTIIGEESSIKYTSN